MANESVGVTYEAKDLHSAVASQVTTNMGRVSRSADQANARMSAAAREGSRKLENGLIDLARSQLGVSSTGARLAESLLLLGVGGGVVTAVAAGAALIGAAWRSMTGPGEEARKKSKEITEQLLQQATAAREATFAFKEQVFEQQKQQVREFLADNLPASLRGQRPGPGQIFPEGGAIETYLRLKGKLQDYVNLLTAARQAQDNLFQAGSLPRPDIEIPGGGGRTTKQGRTEAVDWMAVLHQVTEAAIRGIEANREWWRSLRGIDITPQRAELGQAPDVKTPEIDRVLSMQKDMESLAKQMELMIGQTIGDAIYNAFAAAFSGEGFDGIFEAFSKTILAGFGKILTDLGMVYLQYGIVINGLAKFLPNPFTAGPAAIAIGAALVAMGAALGAVAGSGGGVGRGTAGAGAFREPRYNTGSEFAARGNASENAGSVTVRVPRGLYVRSDDPDFIDFMARVVQEARGRRIIYEVGE